MHYAVHDSPLIDSIFRVYAFVSLVFRVSLCLKTIDSFDPALQLPEPNPRASRLERCRDISFSLLNLALRIRRRSRIGRPLVLHVLPLCEELSRLQIMPSSYSKLYYLLVSSAFYSPHGSLASPEKAYPQYMQ